MATEERTQNIPAEWWTFAMYHITPRTNGGIPADPFLRHMVEQARRNPHSFTIDAHAIARGELATIIGRLQELFTWQTPTERMERRTPTADEIPAANVRFEDGAYCVRIELWRFFLPDASEVATIADDIQTNLEAENS